MEEIRKRGRPRTRFIDENAVKRPRGRPKKVVDESEVKEKRPRGRPRKIVDTPQVKRPRGRPRKDGLPVNSSSPYTIEKETCPTVQPDNPFLRNPSGYINPLVESSTPSARPVRNPFLIEEMDPVEDKKEQIEEPIIEDFAVDEIDNPFADEIQDAEVLDKSLDELISFNPPKAETMQNVVESAEIDNLNRSLDILSQHAKQPFSNTNKLIVVTGATSGMGFAMAKNLAGLGQTVIAVGRRPSLARDCRNEILDAYPNANIHYLIADLSLMSQVRILADEIKAKVRELGYNRIDVLIHNAGINTNTYKLTYENNEIMWATNYLSVFLLTREVQPLLDNSVDARVITITNSQNFRTKLNWDDIRGTTQKSNEKVYNQTKLADLMFALEYDHRYSERDDLHAYCVDPGFVATPIHTKNMSGIRRWALDRWSKKGKTIEQGIETTMYLALAEKLPKNVVFYENKKPAEPSKYALDQRNRAALWRYSEIALRE